MKNAFLLKGEKHEDYCEKENLATGRSNARQFES